MSDETNDVRERLQEVARTIEVILPPHTGFALLTFDLDTAVGRCEYVANAKREDIILVMKQWIEKNENPHNFGKHLK